MYNLILCIILISAIPSSFSKEPETCSSSVVTAMDHKEIDVDSYCRDKPCLVKCCGQNEVVHIYGVNGVGVEKCKDIDVLKKYLVKMKNITDFSSVPSNYSDIPFYDNNIYKNSEVLTSKKFGDFTLLQRSMFKNGGSLKTGTKCAFHVGNAKLLEKGTLVLHKPNQYEYWAPKKTADFCVDMAVGTYKNRLRHNPYYMIKISDSVKRADKNFYTAISKVQYFLILASFFWLKLMSFDIWWTFRGTWKHHAIHRRGIYVKFLIYAIYAFGIPAAMTIFASKMDEKDLPEHVVKPFFKDGFLSKSMTFYLYIPIIILTTLNCLLFIMTVYNIWLISRNLANFDKTTVSKNKRNQNRFMLFIKLISIMGVSWILEIVQNTLDPESIAVWLDIVINGYNLLIGVIIFFLFIFKKSIFLMLCKRFNIENRWTRRAYAVNSTRSTQLSKIPKNDSSKNSRSNDWTRSNADSDVE